MRDTLLLVVMPKEHRHFRADLYDSLVASWDADTVRKGDDWNEKVPSLNQCCVTALVVQNYLGGDLLRCKMSDGDSHYWNRLPDKHEIDWTREQFSHISARPLWQKTEVRNRKKILSYKSTRERYEILKNRVVTQMGKKGYAIISGIYD